MAVEGLCGLPQKEREKGKSNEDYLPTRHPNQPNNTSIKQQTTSLFLLIFQPKMASTFTNAGIRFSRAMIMVRGAEGVAQSVNFYQNALGMSVVRHTDDWAELACGVAGSDLMAPSSAHFRLNIKAVGSEAQLSVGYSPFLSYEVDDMDGTVARCAQMGAHLDGPIQYPAHGKVATLRAPDGHMIGLYEPAI